MIKYLSLLFLSFNLWGSEWVVNSDHSEIKFRISYLQLSEVTGRFTQFKSKLLFRLEELEEVFVEISTDSIFTGNKKRDKHLKGTEFFKVKDYPHIHFVSRKVNRLKDNRYRIRGVLTIKNRANEIDILASLSKSSEDTWGFQSQFLKFESVIKRSDFGLTWNKTLKAGSFLVGDEVKLYGVFQLQPLSHLTPALKHMIPDTTYIRAREQLKRKEISDKKFKQKFAKYLEQKEVKEEVNNTEKIQAKESFDSQVETPTLSIKGRDWLWWLSYLLLGLSGFLGAIFSSIHLKTLVSEHFKEKYNEAGLWGHLSDSLVWCLILVFSIAYFHIGWGN